MSLSAVAQATLLLTCRFGKAHAADAKPLSNAEWSRLALRLKARNATPADLLAADCADLFAGWSDRGINRTRIAALCARGHSMALALEKWQRAGLWVITRSDREYPGRLKRKLQNDAPAVLFGCGDKSMLDNGGLAAVGSRNAGAADLSFANELGEKAASAGMSIVSGAARGVDEAAMFGALHRGGHALGVMATGLLHASTANKWRDWLLQECLVLLSPFHPEAGFNAGNAMARNKYIYCLSDAALVVHSGNRGGTLNGAMENLKNRWVPLWVKPTQDARAANHVLVARGGRWCADEARRISPRELRFPNDDAVAQSNGQTRTLFSDEAIPALPLHQGGALAPL